MTLERRENGPGTKRHTLPESLNKNTQIAILVIVIPYPGLLSPIKASQVVKRQTYLS